MPVIVNEVEVVVEADPPRPAETAEPPSASAPIPSPIELADLFCLLATRDTRLRAH